MKTGLSFLLLICHLRSLTFSMVLKDSDEIENELLHSQSQLRQSRSTLHINTDSKNVKVIVGNVQTHPPPGQDGVHYDSVIAYSDKVYVTTRYPNPANGNYATDNRPIMTPGRNLQAPATVPANADLAVDIGNVGGDHRNHIIIGGVQKYGKQSPNDIIKLLIDANNRDGIHQNSVTIGGMLIY